MPICLMHMQICSRGNDEILLKSFGISSWIVFPTKLNQIIHELKYLQRSAFRNSIVYTFFFSSGSMNILLFYHVNSKIYHGTIHWIHSIRIYSLESIWNLMYKPIRLSRLFSLKNEIQHFNSPAIKGAHCLGIDLCACSEWI